MLGKTVTTEFAFLQPGRTRNPHNLDAHARRLVVGLGRAVAAGMLPIAIGTQTGGSVIRPAAYCGVAGFKPSYRLLPTVGMKCFAWSSRHRRAVRGRASSTWRSRRPPSPAATCGSTRRRAAGAAHRARAHARWARGQRRRCRARSSAPRATRRRPARASASRPAADLLDRRVPRARDHPGLRGVSRARLRIRQSPRRAGPILREHAGQGRRDHRRRLRRRRAAPPSAPARRSPISWATSTCC